MLCSNGVIYDAPSYLSPAIDIAIGLCLVALIWWVRANQDSTFVQALEWKPLEHLGKISYGFYLVHNFIPNPLGKALTLYGGMSVPDSVKITAGAAIGFVISYAVAHVSWKYFEIADPAQPSRPDQILPAIPARKSLAGRAANRAEIA